MPEIARAQRSAASSLAPRIHHGPSARTSSSIPGSRANRASSASVPPRPRRRQPPLRPSQPRALQPRTSSLEVGGPPPRRGRVAPPEVRGGAGRHQGLSSPTQTPVEPDEVAHARERGSSGRGAGAAVHEEPALTLTASPPRRHRRLSDAAHRTCIDAQRDSFASDLSTHRRQPRRGRRSRIDPTPTRTARCQPPVRPGAIARDDDRSRQRRIRVRLETSPRATDNVRSIGGARRRCRRYRRHRSEEVRNRRVGHLHEVGGRRERGERTNARSTRHPGQRQPHGPSARRLGRQDDQWFPSPSTGPRRASAMTRQVP